MASVWKQGVSLPEPMYGMSAVTDGRKIYCTGGFDTGNIPQTKLYIFDIDTGLWRRGQDLPDKKAYHSSVVDNQSVFCFGGYDTDLAVPYVSNTVIRYDIASDRWAQIGTMPRANMWFGCEEYQGRIYCIGGTGEELQMHNCYSYTDIYDIRNNTWSQGSPMPVGKQRLKSTRIESRIYCFGGYTLSGLTDTVDIYDITTDRWSQGAPMPAAKADGIAQTLDDMAFYISGRDYQGPDSRTNDGYNAGENRWKTLPQIPTGRAFMGSVAVNGDIYCIGGSSGTLKHTEVSIYTGQDSGENPGEIQKCCCGSLKVELNLPVCNNRELLQELKELVQLAKTCDNSACSR